MAKRGIIFKEAPVIKPGRSWFDDSHRHLTTCNIGELIVGHISDHMAGEVIKFRNDIFGRLDTTISPTYGEVDLFNYYFYVNKRHIWPQWKQFRPNADQMKTWEQAKTFVPPVMPYITLSDMRNNSNVVSISNPPRFNSNNLAMFIPSAPSSVEYAYALINVFKTSNYHGDYTHSVQEVIALDNANYGDIPIDSTSDDYLFSFVVVYKRNFQEVQSLGGNLWYKNDNLVKTLNIFSPGTLFNYMQCNIEALNKERSDLFQFMIRSIFSDNYQYEYIDYYQCDYPVLRDFCNRHFVAGIYIVNRKEFLNYGPCLSITDSETYAFKYVEDSESNMEIDSEETLTTDSIIDEQIDGTKYKPFYKASFDSRINTLPIRAYEYIYDEYFRDENWIPVNTYVDFTRNGEEHYNTAEQIRYFSLKKKAWAHDPYTSGLPGPQRGDAVRFLSDASLKFSDGGTISTKSRNLSLVSDGTTYSGLVAASSEATASTGRSVQVSVDLSAATIESFRFASALQEYRELFARTGGRYPEWQLSVMGANISDIEDERPIYIYGSRNPVQMSEVVQTSATDVSTGQPLGDLAGKGVIVGKGDYIEYKTPDDGYFVQIIAVVPKLSYQSGINPLFTRHNWLDFPIPKFAQLGEELVKTGSLWFTGISDIDEKAFAYQSRYWEWKYSRDYTTGQLTDSLDFWTFTRQFEDEPVNGQDFIEVNVDYRQFAVQDRGYHHVSLSIWQDVQKNLALPVFGIPTL